MKIISWNCNGALRKKTDVLDQIDADILVIQECEDPSQSTKKYQEWAGEYLWVGTSKNKGIGIFPKNAHKVTKLEWHGEFQINGFSSQSSSLRWKTSDLNLFLPFKINDKITALGVWTKGKDSQIFSYMGQFWKYLQIHRNDLKGEQTLLIGDFNSNAIWDKEDRWWSHSDVLNELSEIGIESLYHKQFNEAQGEESQPTFFLHRKEEKAYHIDYAFMSKDCISNAELNIGARGNWITVSDHLPLIINLSL